MIELENLYPLKHGAVEFLYSLMEERGPEVNISHKNLPSFKDHQKFVEGYPFNHWYLILENGMRVGYISATFRNEIGIILAKSHRGKGIGEKVIKQFIQDHEPLPPIPGQRSDKWLANVAVGNAPSHKLFAKLGHIIQITYELEKLENPDLGIR